MKFKSIAVALAAVGSIPTAQAAGFYLKEQSIVSQGAAFAGTTARTDVASSVYFNPAGIAGMQSMIEAGVHLLIPDQTVTGTQAIGLMSTAAQEPLSNSTIPNFYYVRPLESGVLGFGVSAPFGSKNEYSDAFIGSLDTAKTKLKTVDYSFAYGRSISEKARAGLAIVYQTADIEQRKVVSSQLLGQATNSTATLKGDSTTLGLTVGMQFDLKDGGTLGVAYKKGTTQEITGTNTISANFNLSVAGVGAIPIAAGAYAASGDLNLPSMLSVSLIRPVSESTSLMFDVTRYGWSSYDKLDVATEWGAPLGAQTTSSPQNYSDTTSFSFGAEHDYGNGLVARAGMHFDPTPTNDTDRSFSTPDGDRTWLAFGLSKTIENGATLDFAYTRIDVDKSDINRRINSAITARATAESTFNIVSVGIRLPLD